MVKSAYIHIPFCKSKCHYCSFVSFCNLEQKDAYVDVLKQEIIHFYEKEVLNTIYLGGGTPSVLSIAKVESVLRLLNYNKNSEITMECNPDDLDYGYLRSLYDIGINRISLGCQTFDDKILKLINRRHNAGQIIDSVKMAQDAGFKNISLDFIYGLPTQTIDSFIKDLERAVNLGVQHISLYGLKLEQGCYFYKKEPKGLADDDLQAEMFMQAIETLSNMDFEHYEVSNFSRLGFNSKHNLNYWNNEEYYGFGLGAHGYKDGVRYENLSTLVQYLENPFLKAESHLLPEQARLEEEIFLGLRKMVGIDVEKINSKYLIDFDVKYKKIIEKYLDLNLLKKTQMGYAFTNEGILLSNVILAEFLE